MFTVHSNFFGCLISLTLLPAFTVNAQQFSVTRYDAATVAESPVVVPSVAVEDPVAMLPAVSAVANPLVGEPLTVKKIDMFKGEIRVFKTNSVVRVAVGDGAVIRAEVIDSGELLVIAQHSGSTSLRLWHADSQQSDYNIRVGDTDPETRFHLEKMVTLRVKMVEFRKSALARLGIDWSNAMAGPTFATAGDVVSNTLYRPATEGFGTLPNNVRPFSSYFGIASSITSRINFLSASGEATMLAEPTLSCANGSSASFLAGGEVPYPTVGANGQTSVEFKEYGIKLEISPRIDTLGNVQTGVMTEISSIDPAVSVQGAPGLLTRRTQTEVNVRSGQTIVIAGLLKAENSSDIDRIPGIGRLPVLGKLFSSDNMRNDISELVIFITPEVFDPAAVTLGDRHKLIHSRSGERLIRSADRLDINLLD